MPDEPSPPSPSQPLPAEKVDKNAWGRDQEERRYYYDDAHGYEKYDPDADDDDEDQECENGRNKN